MPASYGVYAAERGEGEQALLYRFPAEVADDASLGGAVKALLENGAREVRVVWMEESPSFP